MPSLSTIPKPFLNKDALPMFIEWLKLLPTSASNKKELLNAWSLHTGGTLSQQHYKDITTTGLLIDGA